MEHKRAVELVLIGMERTTCLIDCCSIYERIYLSMDSTLIGHLKDHLIKLYVSIYTYLGEAIRTAKRNILGTIFSTGGVTDYIDKITESEQNLNRIIAALAVESIQALLQGSRVTDGIHRQRPN